MNSYLQVSNLSLILVSMMSLQFHLKNQLKVSSLKEFSLSKVSCLELIARKTLLKFNFPKEEVKLSNMTLWYLQLAHLMLLHGEEQITRSNHFKKEKTKSMKLLKRSKMLHQFYLLEEESQELRAVHGSKKSFPTRKLDSVKEENYCCQQSTELIN